MMDDFTFFIRGPLSQWYPSPFRCPADIEFNCAEQFMMAEKAIAFNDEETLQKILKSKSPSEQKKLGRKVKNYDDATWAGLRFNAVYRGNYYKFTQNPNLWDVLRATAGTTLVEVNPKDCIWGIGLSETDPRRFDRSQWRGLNLLGQVLTQLRRDLGVE